MSCWNVNLLSREQLAALGLTKPEIELVVQRRPIASILDLLFDDEIRELAVRTLIAQGVFAGLQDTELVLGDAPISPGPQSIAFDDEDDKSDDDDGGSDSGGDGAGGDAEAAQSFGVISDDSFYELSPPGTTDTVVVPDCTTTETIEVKGFGSSDRIFQPGENRATIEGEAKMRAKVARATGIGTVATKSSCLDKQNQGCKSLTIKILKLDTKVVFTLPRKKRMMAIQKPGWKARYLAYAKIEILCL